MTEYAALEFTLIVCETAPVLHKKVAPGIPASSVSICPTHIVVSLPMNTGGGALNETFTVSEKEHPATVTLTQ